MDRCPCAWTVHDAPAPKLAATPALPSRQGPLLLCPHSPASTSDTPACPQFPQPITASPHYRRPTPAKAIPATRQNLAPQPRPHRHSRSNSGTKPIKDLAPNPGFSSLHGFLTFAAISHTLLSRLLPAAKLRKPFTVTAPPQIPYPLTFSNLQPPAPPFLRPPARPPALSWY
jgi:hypothetical protein